ncbi:YjiH family protein, partial [Streptococcus pneumoniae]|nr:YjiH family protein [Streptococcus pneumoniae]
MTSTNSVNSSIQSHDGEVPRPEGRWKLFVYSAIGAFVFFFPVTYKEKNS